MEQENGVDGGAKNKAGDTPAHILLRKGLRRHWRRAGSWYVQEGITPYDREKLHVLHLYKVNLDVPNAKGSPCLPFFVLCGVY